MESFILNVTLLALLSLAAVYDLRHHKVPNAISLAGWLLAPLLHSLAFGMDGLVSSVLGLAAIFVLTFPLFALRWMGAADVKLMVSVGAFVGINSALMALTFIVLAGAIFALLYHSYKGSFSVTLNRLIVMTNMSAMMRRHVYVPPIDDTSKILIPYAVPIAIGTLFYLLFENWEITGF